jgi:hypothetical protein
MFSLHAYETVGKIYEGYSESNLRWVVDKTIEDFETNNKYSSCYA